MIRTPRIVGRGAMAIYRLLQKSAFPPTRSRAQVIDMGQCTYCGKPAGWFRREHPECLAQHDRGRQHISAILDGLLQKADVADQLIEQTADVARTHFISQSELRSLMIGGFKKAGDAALVNDTLSEDDEQKLIRLQSSFGLVQTDLDGFAERIAKVATLRDVGAGRIRPHIDLSDSPIALQKSETPIWAFNNVELHEVKTRTQFIGGGQGLSLRITRGVYYRVGAGRGKPVQSQNLEKQDTGSLVVTNQNIYFVGPLKSIRINLRKLVTVQGFSDGISVTRESSNPKPVVFKLDDPCLLEILF